ncbi:hypothetical protein L3Q82_008332 [Scortum barcoo]|uniref:Uncharacterized protein n=1 Tax=Scortum barcoo TaxID=214431 RepID=A0ACB8WHP0_9TELE|nr:hypothetical protein L3Q82_008332 [Scortum barcoo]
MHFTETWLNHLTPDSLVQAGRISSRQSGQEYKGEWSNNVPGTLSCWPVSIRPYYLPREFSHVIAITTYIPPSANADAACELLHSVVAQLQTEHPQAFLLITRDFNHASLSATLPNFHQYVNCCTRDNKTLDLLYANTAGAYSSSPLPPLGHSDHNLVHLCPVYTPMVKRQPPNKRRVKQWSEEASDALRDCFDTTDWEVLCGPHEQDIDSLTDCITDYINFCVETTVPTKRDCVSDVVVCSTGAPQGTVLSPFLFTLYTSDFTYSTDSCHLQKFSDDTAIVGCVSEGNDCEYRKVIMDFVDWCELNHLQVNASKTKEMVIDFSRKPSADIAPAEHPGT